MLKIAPSLVLALRGVCTEIALEAMLDATERVMDSIDMSCDSVVGLSPGTESRINCVQVGSA